MGVTSIEWTDRTWNPVRGCSRVSSGCERCYAEGIAARFSGPGLAYEGLATIGKNGPHWTGEVVLVADHLVDPMTWKKPARVFVNSMSDLFHEELTNEQIAAVFGVMAACMEHTFQVLTKRPARMLGWFRWLQSVGGLAPFIRQHPDRLRHYFAAGARFETYRGRTVRSAKDAWARVFNAAGVQSPVLPNVWLGVSVEDQATADERIPLLLQTPAAVRFISAEPLLGPLRVDDLGDGRGGVHKPLVGLHWVPTPRGMVVKDGAKGPRLDWVIVGGESGPRARPCALEWIEGVVDQCRTAGTPVFVKQLGAFVVSEQRACATDEEAKATFGLNSRWLWRAGLSKGNKKGQKLNELTPEFNIRMFPGDAWPPPAPPAEEEECAF